MRRARSASERSCEIGTQPSCGIVGSAEQVALSEALGDDLAKPLVRFGRDHAEVERQGGADGRAASGEVVEDNASGWGDDGQQGSQKGLRLLGGMLAIAD